MATQAQRREGTRAKILAAAQVCFAADGYEGASLDDIMAKAGVSKGALYHHFANKLAILAALYEAAASAAVAQGQAAAQAPDIREGPALVRIVAACLGWLDAVKNPDAASLVLDLGPRVLGWAWAREIEERYSAAPMQAALALAVSQGEAKAAHLALAARVIHATLAEIALTRRETPISDADAAAMVRAVVKGVAGAA
jgi:AcrR family transcriptional regulator